MTVEALDEDSELILRLLREKVFSDLGDGYGKVYLDACIPHEWSKCKANGHLSVLSKADLYQRIDGLFGKVKLEAL